MIDRDNVRDILPLTPMQEGLLFHAVEGPAPGLYHVQLRYEIEGDLDPQLFARACNAAVERHDALRAVFVHGRSEKPLQVILRKRPADVRIGVGDPAADLAEPFDLSRGPLIRFYLIRRAERQWTVMLSFHHIVMDGWCSALLLGELLEIYTALRRGEASRLEPAPPLGAYFAWLRATNPAAAVQHWTESLEGWSGIARAPGWRPPAGPPSLQTVVRALSADDARAIARAAAELQVTVPSLIEALWGVLLARQNQTTDAVFGLVVSGRPPEVHGIERMIGLFVNSLPQRVTFEEDEELGTIAARVHRQAIALTPHHHASLAAIQAASGGTRLFDHLLAVQSYPRPGGAADDGLRVTGVAAREASNYDLVVKVAPGEPFVIEIDFNAAAYDGGTVEQIAERSADALVRVARDPRTPARDLPPLCDSGEEKTARIAIPVAPAEPLALHDPIVTRVLALWAEVLGDDDIAPDDSFFEIGGHSLKAMQLVAKLRRAFGVPIGVREIFERPTAAAQAALVRGRARAADEPITPAPPAPHYPLSHAQQRVWLVEKLSGASATYNIPLTCVCGPGVDRDALERALRALVERHEVLRTTFVEIDGVPRQTVRDAGALRIETIDLRAARDAADEARAITAQEVAHPFDLTREIPLRATFVLLPAGETLLIVNIHHIAADGWSLRLLSSELEALYAGEPLPPQTIQYKDYAVWESQRDLSADEVWWRQTLRGRVELVRLPHDLDTGHAHRFSGGGVFASLDAAATARLRALAAARQTTLANVVLAVFFAFLHRLTAQRSLSVAVSVANRALHPELERLAGFFVNAIVVHVDVDPDDDFAVFLRQVVETSLAAFEHQSYPFDLVVEKLRPARVSEEQPLFNVNYVFQSFRDLRLRGAAPPRPIGELREITPPATTAKFDLTLFVCESDGALQVAFEFSRRLFAEESVRRYLGMFVDFLHAAGGELQVEAAS